MKNILNRVLALAVALLVLCAPIGAMAEEMPSALHATLALSNLRLTMGEEVNAQVDVTAQLDLSADLNAGAFAGTLTALSGANKALKGGFHFDPASMNLTAALEGATDAVLLPVGELMEQLQAQMSEAIPGEGIAGFQKVMDAMMNLQGVIEDSDFTALSEIVTTWIGQQITAAETGVSLQVDDMTITADKYDFEVTAQELVTLTADLIKTVQADADLTAAIQAYIDTIIELTGEEASFDLATLDVDALMADMPEDEVMTIAGSLYVNGEEGHVVLNCATSVTEGDETIAVPYQFIMLNKGETTYVGFYTETAETEQDGNKVTLSVDVNATNDDKPVFDVTVTQNSVSDGQESTAVFTIAADCAEGADITVYLENSASFTYNDETYKSLSAFGANYTGDTVSDENGIAANGTLTLYMNQDGQEITFSADTLAALTADSNVDFDMPNNLIDLSKADSDTMEALGQEYMQVLSKGLMTLMGAPGMENLTSLFGMIG